MENSTGTAGRDDAGKRIDRILRRMLPRLPLGALYRLLRQGAVRVNGERVRLSHRVAEGDQIRVSLREADRTLSNKRHKDNSRIQNANFTRWILYENEHVLALNKPYGLLVHGPDSLSDLVRAYRGENQPASLSFRPGPVHRLDRNTTGIQLFALSLSGARILTRLFHDHRVDKIYCAIVDGRLNEPLEWQDHLFRDRERNKTIPGSRTEGMIAVTRVIPIVHEKNHSLVFFLPQTGRTHQIRSQSALHGHPLSGDAKYGGTKTLPHIFLHNLGLKIDSQELALLLTAQFDDQKEQLIAALFGPSIMKKIYMMAEKLLE